MPSDATRIIDYLNSNKELMISHLTDLVLAESPSLVPESQDRVFDLMEKPLRTLGYQTKRFPGVKSGGQLYASPAVADSQPMTQLLLGHCDTVWPEGTLEEMPVVVDGNVMKGPGVYDMKVGLTQILFALKTLSDLGIRTSIDPVVLITSDEEIGSADSREKIESLAAAANRVYIPEPSTGPEGKLKTARKGVGVFQLIIKGRSAHAGVEPQKGVSTVLELPKIIETLDQLNDPATGVSVNIGLIEAGTRTNIVPDRCEIGVDVRVPGLEDAIRIDSTIRALKTIQPKTTLEIQGGIERPPMEKTARNRALWSAARETAKQLGLELEESYTGGGSDGNFTSPITATLDGLGGVGGGAHAKNEFILLDKMIERTALLALLLTLPQIGVE